jgi:hypothetical protein
MNAGIATITFIRGMYYRRDIVERWIDKAVKEANKRIEKELRKQLLELAEKSNGGDSMCDEQEKTEFEKAVELLSVHFNVDENIAKRMIEFAFAKPTQEIKVPNVNHEFQIPRYFTGLNEELCDPPIIKNTAVQEIFIPVSWASYIKYVEKENDITTSRNMEVRFEVTKLSDEKRNKIGRLVNEILQVIKD